ncbi:sulfatase [Verrucomicrobiales bacterium BCK34]|nr:sulfatase [Verrucomicrobiales bacterium BCK34]
MRFLLLISLFAATGVSLAEDRPNFLFLFADDWGRHASIYGEAAAGGVNDVVSTPTFDRIARDGVLFNYAHVSAPSCTPCRTAVITGQHFWRTGTGSILLGAVYPDHIPGFPDLLRDAGYHIGYTYKVWAPGTPRDAPFTADEQYHDAGTRFNGFSQNVTKLLAGGQLLDEAKEELLNEVRGNFRAFLADQEEGQPFCYWFGPTNVHRKWIKGSGKALWGIDPDSLKGKMPAFLPDVPAVRQDLADYLGEVAAWDASMAVILEELEKSGQSDNTLIAVSGDHGAPGFPHGKCNLYDFGTGVALAVSGPGVKGGRIVDDLTSLTDLAPTFLAAAGLDVPGEMTGRSLWPVLESGKEGLIDETRTRVFTGRERHVDSARADFMPYPQRCIRTHDYALIVNFRPDRWPMGDPYGLEDGESPSKDDLENDTRITLRDEDAGPTKAWLVGARGEEAWKSHFDWVYGKRPKYELYDLSKDPDETQNVADDPDYKSIRARLEAELLAELKATGDPRLVEDGKFFETSPMSDPAKPMVRPKPKSKAKSQPNGKANAKR